jgi:hypothetical protein
VKFCHKATKRRINPKVRFAELRDKREKEERGSHLSLSSFFFAMRNLCMMLRDKKEKKKTLSPISLCSPLSPGNVCKRLREKIFIYLFLSPLSLSTPLIS